MRNRGMCFVSFCVGQKFYLTDMSQLKTILSCGVLVFCVAHLRGIGVNEGKTVRERAAKSGG